MAKAEWGLKRICLSCGGKFYDLLRDPIICPYCGEVFDVEKANRLKRNSSVIETEDKTKSNDLKSDDDLLNSDALEEDDNIADGDDDVLEDTSDLGGTADVPNVIPTSDNKDDI